MGFADQSYLPRKGSSKYGASKAPHLEDEEYVRANPALGALLSISRVDDKPRESARLSIFCDGGRLKFCVSDTFSGMVIFGTLDASESWSDQIETFLTTHADEWRTAREKK